MTQEQLLSEFLCLGNTSKMDDSSAVGGFGIASAALLRNPEWSVRSLDTYVDNTYFYSDKEMPTLEMFNGTEVKVRIDESTYAFHLRAVQEIVRLSAVKCVLTMVLDGQSRTYEHDGTIPLHEEHITDKYALYSYLGDDVDKEHVYVSLHGLAQFYMYYEVPYPLWINLTPDVRPEHKDYPLNMSRESLTAELSSEITEYIQEHFVKRPTEAIVEREFALNEVKDLVSDGALIVGRRGHSSSEVVQQYGDAPITFDSIAVRKDVDVEESSRERTALLLTNYHSEGRDINKDAKLLWLWQEILREVCSPDDVFGIGFICHDRVKAARAYNAEVKRIFYQINPDISMASPKSMVLFLHHLACHESAHMQEPNHGEAHAGLECTIFQETIYEIIEHINYYTAIIEGI
jgi:hypothetical protein